MRFSVSAVVPFGVVLQHKASWVRSNEASRFALYLRARCSSSACQGGGDVGAGPSRNSQHAACGTVHTTALRAHHMDPCLAKNRVHMRYGVCIHSWIDSTQATLRKPCKPKRHKRHSRSVAKIGGPSHRRAETSTTWIRGGPHFRLM